ncbi:hypothetical protein H4Q32_030244 [Labeo rohita]|uniref:ribonuclease H n=1 Tax=Labeo rohita TaxID=84645 RepID=A0ABQ8M2X4_LABRO|nr:hypothetical protein H4Q32_030244 [Labeo rohita]
MPPPGGIVQASASRPKPVPRVVGSTSQPVTLVDPDGSTRLRDPVRKASAQVQGHPVHICLIRQRCLSSACSDCGSPGKIEPAPPAKMESGFYSPYFIVSKKSSGLRLILNLLVLNQSLHRLPFKMLTSKRIISCICHQDWFTAVDLKDVYFHVSILRRHRPFLRFAFEGRVYQYKVLPFGLALSPRVFTKLVESLHTQLSLDLLCEHRDRVLRHLSHLGLQVNWEKSKLSPVQGISFLGMELDSVNMMARLTEERAQSVLSWTRQRSF